MVFVNFVLFAFFFGIFGITAQCENRSYRFTAIIKYPLSGCQVAGKTLTTAETSKLVIQQLEALVIYKIRTSTCDCEYGVSLRTEFLSTIGFEIIHVPELLPLNEFLAICKPLECVAACYPDTSCTMPTPIGLPYSNVKPFVQMFPISPQRIKPNDRYFPSQWHLSDAEKYSLQIQESWVSATGTNSTVIAVVDNGCDFNHQDLKDVFWKNPNEICGDGIDNDGNGLIDDCYGWDFARNRSNPTFETNSHGTMVAGLTAATTNNKIGTASVCWNCKIMCLKFIGNSTGTISNEIKAINYAVSMGVKISVNSYGGYRESAAEYDAIRTAGLLGHIFIGSAGNDNTNVSMTNHYPSSYNLTNIISVAASNQTGERAPFSNYGKEGVHVFAPGVRLFGPFTGNRYLGAAGTSYGAPLVAGVVGVVWSAFPELSYDKVIDAVVYSCQKKDSLAGLAKCPGVVNVKLALARAAQLAQQ